MIVLRALVRLVGFLLLAVLALAGAAIAVFCIQGGDTGLSPAALAEALRLHEWRDAIDSFLDDLEGSGALDLPALLGALGAIVVAVLLLAGALVPTRERLVSVAEGDGRLAARRRALAEVARALGERADGVTRIKARVRPGRRRGGTVRVRADHVRPVKPEDARRAVERELAPVTDGFGLKARVRARLGERDARVQ